MRFGPPTRATGWRYSLKFRKNIGIRLESENLRAGQCRGHLDGCLSAVGADIEQEFRRISPEQLGQVSPRVEAEIKPLDLDAQWAEKAFVPTGGIHKSGGSGMISWN
jgi:hypothetical protein